MAASERIANRKSENPLSVSKFVSRIEMDFWKFTLEGLEGQQMHWKSFREIP